VIPLPQTLLASALVASLAANVWMFVGRSTTERNLARAESRLADERAGRERERADAAVALAAATEQARQTEAQWREKQTEVQAHAQARIRAAAADAARARDAVDSLQRRAEVIAAQCANPARDSAGPDPSFAPRGAPAQDPGALLAQLLRGVTQAAAELAAVADARGAAGVACEGAYDALVRPGLAGKP
jgi:hypothetical protein